MNPERFFHRAEIRAVGDNGMTIDGYAAVFDKPFETPWMVEYIDRAAFTRAINEKQDVRGLIDHESTLIIGRTTASTLRLSVDDVGLKFECDLPDTQYARDLAVSIRRKDISGCSFQFVARKEQWEDATPKPVRRLLDVDLLDVGPVTFPAYGDTSVAVRSLEQWREQQKRSKTPLLDAASRRLRLAQVQR